jgi:hypothetical protein
VLILDDPGFVFDPEAREKVVKALAWPEDEEIGDARQDAHVRSTAASLGVDIDKQMAAVMQARAEAGIEETP